MNERYGDRPTVGGEETLVRYVGGSHVDSSTGIINGSAFERTAKDTDGVSLTRRGILAAAKDHDREAIKKVVGSRLSLGKTAVFAEIRAGAVLDCLAEFEQGIFICEDPLPEVGLELANPAHALIIGFPFQGESIGSLKSEEAGDRLRHQIQDRFPAI